jgi:uncharacterized membrane protein YidH (DUF202 family)
MAARSGDDDPPGAAESPEPGPAAAPGGDLDDLEQRDAGLARERTSLAWTRTAISFAALGGAVMKVSLAPGLVIVLLAPVAWSIGRLPRPGAQRLWLIMASIVLVALVSLGVVLASRGTSGALRG